MEVVDEHRCFGGRQLVYEHESLVLRCRMRFGVYLPPQAAQRACPVLYWLSGLTCTEQNFVTKAGAQQYAAEHGLILIAPDTSPRGDGVADDDAYDLGKGAGFYLNATAEPWAAHYRMYDYIVDELPKLVEEHLPTSGKAAIAGHSMGGHGALVIALRNPERFVSVSCFAPIVNPSDVPWGQKAFRAYLGEERANWDAYDATRLLADGARPFPILIDQGSADPFLPEQLQPTRFESACHRVGQTLELRNQEGYDHSYFFIASFIGEHIAFHARHLNA